ncbi:MAG: hypothetical protein ACLQVL_35340 [Terriglobia bacterium]
MKAKSIRLSLLSLVFVALAGAVAPREAKADEVEIGKFTLPAEIHWAGAVLPAGTYSIAADSLDSSTMVYVSRESDPTARYFVPALTKRTIRTSSEKIRLLLDQSNGEVYVKELEVGSEGIAYLFSEPKLKK